MPEHNHWEHHHLFHIDSLASEKRTRIVIALTAITMVVEIVSGTIFNSMALLADGWHMSTHAAALSITAFAYCYARRHAGDSRYTFGTGKVAVLGGFASAIALGVVALVMAAESVERLVTPREIRFSEAILVAIVGLIVNVISALLLKEHPHEHCEHSHHHEHHHHDYNLRAAYLHVIADALTSVLAIFALTAGKFSGWIWLDPLMGIVGAAVISQWAYTLVRDTSKVLLDSAADEGLREEIRQSLQSNGTDRITDLHLWYVGPRHLAAVISVATKKPKTPDHYKKALSAFTNLSHVTVEVNDASDVNYEEAIL